MCGLAGFIGKSTDIDKTRILITELFERTQVRGTDASGFYCVSQNSSIYYKKQPGPSTLLINTDEYRNIWNDDIVSGIFHCRAASVGVGEPSDNTNNHPFVSEDNLKAVIHNGLINPYEYSGLLKEYTTQSRCDSEIILRVLEQGEDLFKNFSKLYKNTKNSFFAFIFSVIDENSKKLFITRNKHRPLYFVDLTEDLGQVFIFSTLEILTNCLWNLKRKGILYKNLSSIYSLKPYDLIQFSYNCDGKLTKDFFISRNQEQQGPDDVINKFCDLEKDILKIKKHLRKKDQIQSKVNNKLSFYIEEIKNKINSISFDFK